MRKRPIGTQRKAHDVTATTPLLLQSYKSDLGTYFGLFGGDLTVTFGETSCVAHRIGHSYRIGADGEGQDRGGRDDEVPPERDGSYAALHDGLKFGRWFDAFLSRSKSMMMYARIGGVRYTAAAAYYHSRRRRRMRYSVCRRQVFQTTTPPLLLPPPSPPPPPPPTPPTPPPPPVPKTADRSSNPPTHPPIRIVIMYLRACASALAEYCCKRGWRCRLQRLRRPNGIQGEPPNTLNTPFSFVCFHDESVRVLLYGGLCRKLFSG